MRALAQAARSHRQRHVDVDEPATLRPCVGGAPRAPRGGEDGDRGGCGPSVEAQSGAAFSVEAILSGADRGGKKGTVSCEKSRAIMKEKEGGENAGKHDSGGAWRVAVSKKRVVKTRKNRTILSYFPLQHLAPTACSLCIIVASDGSRGRHM